jgi:hypothetical protein
MAVVAIGGLLTSIVMILFLLPLSYLHIKPDQSITDIDTAERRDEELEVAVR